MVHRTVTRVAVGSLLLLLASTAGVGATPAPPDPCDPPDCVAWGTLVATTYGRGTFLAESRPGDVARLTVGMIWLDIDRTPATLRLVGSTERCSQPHGPGDRVLRYTHHFDSDGELFDRAAVPLAVDLAGIRSFRVRVATGDVNADTVDCIAARVARVVEHGSPASDGGYSRIGPDIHGVVTVRDTDGDGSGQVAYAIDGLVGDRRYTLFGSTAACGEHHEAADLVFEITFRTGKRGSRAAAVVAPVHLDLLGFMRSVRLVRGPDADGTPVDCSRAFGIDVWEHA